ncbi:hypothetical protein ZWY2020_054527 [Hordeum vulgare]|nr:hypothetical protein ZWY2020_054527 [Hordeum vulgare]
MAFPSSLKVAAIAAVLVLVMLSSSPWQAEAQMQCSSLYPEIWDVAIHFQDLDSLELKLCSDDVVLPSVVALMETRGYGSTDSVYFDKGIGVDGLEKIDSNAKLQQLKRQESRNEEREQKGKLKLKQVVEEDSTDASSFDSEGPIDIEHDPYFMGEYRPKENEGRGLTLEEFEQEETNDDETDSSGLDDEVLPEQEASTFQSRAPRIESTELIEKMCCPSSSCAATLRLWCFVLLCPEAPKVSR